MAVSVRKMPFTLAHTAACIPLARKGLVASALLVGSISPDFAYFFPIPRLSRLSHSLLGIFLFCVPLGLIALWLFHRFLKQPALALLPRHHQEKLIPLAKEFSFWPVRRLAVVIVSLTIGALTHIAWDSFTHTRGWLVQNVDWLRLIIVETELGPLFVHRALQHASTVLGLVCIGWWYSRWLRKTLSVKLRSEESPFGGRMMPIAVCVTLALGLALAYGSASIAFTESYPLRKFLNRTAVGLISILTIQLLIYSGVWHLGRRGERP
jgi:hypothetical protein